MTPALRALADTTADAAAPGDAQAAAEDAAATGDAPVIADSPHPAPLDARSISLGVLAGLAVVFMLHWAAPVLVPVMLGVTLAYALGPAVTWLAVRRVPRVIGAGLVMALLIGLTGFGVVQLRDDATALVESLPQAAAKVRQSLRRDRMAAGTNGTALDKVQQAAVELQKATKEGAPPPPPERGVTRVQIESKPFDLKEALWENTPRVLTGVGEATVVVLLAYFLLAGGLTFRRKLMKIAGSSLTRRKITLQGLDEISDHIQRFLLVQVIVSVIVGVGTWAIYLAVGMTHPAVWGVAAFVLNFIPYLGSIAVTAVATFAAYVQFDSLDKALLVLGASTVLHTVTGYILAPWLTSRNSRLSALSVFLGVIVFGWLWGFWGFLLGVPMLIMIKSFCDRVEGLRPIGELMGR